MPCAKLIPFERPASAARQAAARPIPHIDTSSPRACQHSPSIRIPGFCDCVTCRHSPVKPLVACKFNLSRKPDSTFHAAFQRVKFSTALPAISMTFICPLGQLMIRRPIAQGCSNPSSRHHHEQQRQGLNDAIDCQSIPKAQRDAHTYINHIARACSSGVLKVCAKTRPPHAERGMPRPLPCMANRGNTPAPVRVKAGRPVSRIGHRRPATLDKGTRIC